MVYTFIITTPYLTKAHNITKIMGWGQNVMKKPETGGGKDRIKPRKRKYTSIKQAVEPRYLYDASMAAPPHDPGVPVDSGISAATDTAPPDASNLTADQPAENSTATEKGVATQPANSEQSLQQILADLSNQSDYTSVLQDFTAFNNPQTKELV